MIDTAVCHARCVSHPVRAVNRLLLSCAALCSALALGCGSDDPVVTFDAGSRDVTERVIPDAGGEDVVVAPDAGAVPDTTTTDVATLEDGGADTTVPDTSTPDSGGSDATNRPDLGPIEDPCDLDNDGYRALTCAGGTDCNDESARENPGARELCDFIDNNCNDLVNEGIDCEFYAHTDNEVYLVDPFKRTATLVVETPATIYDFDTANDGTLYALAGSDLFRFDDTRDRWVTVGAMGESIRPNGLAIDSRNVGYATADNDLYRINLETGAATYVGSMGREGSHTFESSGDCVIDKNDVLYMSSRNADRSLDYLARIDASTGDGALIGPTGFSRIYGITAAWGYLFGLTVAGELLQIDTNTGAAELLHTFTVGGSTLRWYGSASSPGR